MARAVAARAFISYRREGAGFASGAIADGLKARYGREPVFLDVESIRPGDDFVEKINTALKSCKVLLALIDRNWLATLNERMSDPNPDFVRIEIETALENGLRVIPVLVDGTPVPDASQLPESLRPLATKNGVELRARERVKDLNILLEALDADLGPPVPPPPQAAAAEDLAKVVRKQWEKETGLRGFHEARMLHVAWQPETEGFETWKDLVSTAGDKAGGEPSMWAATSAGLAGERPSLARRLRRWSKAAAALIPSLAS